MKMLRSWQQRVDDMIGAFDEIESFVAGMDYEEFRADGKVQKAVVADLFVVGETASRLLSDPATRQRAVPWERLCALKEPLLAGRFVLDHEALWRLLQEDVPELAAPVRAFASIPFLEELPSLD